MGSFFPVNESSRFIIAVFPDAAQRLTSTTDAELVERWNRLISIRERVLAEIEPLRKDKRIGSSLQAKVILSAGPSDLAFLERHAVHLPMLFIVSEVELQAGGRRGRRLDRVFASDNNRACGWCEMRAVLAIRQQSVQRTRLGWAYASAAGMPWPKHRWLIL